MEDAKDIANRTTPPPPSKPWVPSVKMVAPKPKDGFRQRYFTQANVEKALAEGWQFVLVDPKKPAPEHKPSTILDGASMDNVHRKRELILMELPEKTAKAREAYHAGLIQDSKKAPVNKFKKDATDDLGKTYGNVEVKEGSKT